MTVPIGLVVDGLKPLPRIVDALLDHPLAVTSDIGVAGAMYKATPQLAAAHKELRSPRPRLHAYIQMGILDESVRCKVAQLSAQTYRRRHGRGDRRDVFLASADLVPISVGLKSLRCLSDPEQKNVLRSISEQPHDKDVLRNELGEAADPSDPDGAVASSNLHLYGLSLKLFIDHIYNPRRQKDLAVVAVLAETAMENPVVFEFWAGPSMPGYGFSVVQDIARQVGGHAVWLERADCLR